MDIYIYMHVHIHIYAQACTPVEIYHAMTYIHKITCTIYIYTHTHKVRGAQQQEEPTSVFDRAKAKTK